MLVREITRYSFITKNLEKFYLFNGKSLSICLRNLPQGSLQNCNCSCSSRMLPSRGQLQIQQYRVGFSDPYGSPFNMGYSIILFSFPPDTNI